MFILIARVHAQMQNLIQYVRGGVWILPFCHMMTVLHAWITLRVAKYHFPWPPQRLCAIKYPLSYLFILQPILTFSVYSVFKTTVIITAPSPKSPSCLSFPFQSKTYFHLQFTLLWYHFSPFRWICFHHGPQLLLCPQGAFVIPTLSPLCSIWCRWVLFPSRNASFPCFPSLSIMTPSQSPVLDAPLALFIFYRP